MDRKILTITVLVLALIGTAFIVAFYVKDDVDRIEGDKKPITPDLHPDQSVDRVAPDKVTESPQAVPGEASTPLPTGQLTGRVIDSRTNEPLEGVVVSTGEPGVGRTEKVSRTDDDGLFKMTGLTCGKSFDLSFRKTGYESYQRKGIELVDGSALDVGDVRLARMPLLSGTVVVPGANPAQQAMVQLTGDDALKIGPDFINDFLTKISDADVAVVATSKCDAMGYFAFSERDVADGVYCLRASAPGWATAIIHNVKIDAAAKSEPMTICLKEAGKLFGKVQDRSFAGIDGALVLAVLMKNEAISVNREISLQKYWAYSDGTGAFIIEDVPEGEYNLVASKKGFANSVKGGVRTSDHQSIEIVLDAGFSLTGMITDSNTGTPVAGAKVIAGSMGSGGGFGESVSGADGKYRIDRLPPGICGVIVTAPGYSGLETTIEGPAGGQVVRNLSLKRGLTVGGRVIDAESGEPVAGALVLSWVPMGGRISRTISGQDGSFKIDGVSGAINRGLQVDAVCDGWFSHLGFPKWLADGEDPSAVEIRLRRCVVISGRVEGPKGKPISGAKVESDCACVSSLIPDGFTEMPRFYSALTDADGLFTVFATPDQKCRLKAKYPGYVDAVTEVEKAPADGVVIRFSAGGTVKGVLLNEKGEFVAGGKVRWFEHVKLSGELLGARDYEVLIFLIDKHLGRTASGEVITGPDGSFEFDNVKTGNIELQYSYSSNHCPDRMAVRVVEEERTIVEFRMQPKLSIAGMVVDDAGSPVAGAIVAFYSEQTQFWGKSLSDSEGRFKVDGLISGNYQGTVQKEIHRMGSQGSVLSKVRAGASDVRFVTELDDTR